MNARTRVAQNNHARRLEQAAAGRKARQRDKIAQQVERALRHQTRGVLGAAYRGREGARYTHVVELSAPDGAEVRVLCRSVKLESLADRCAMDVNAEPTCPTCARRDPRNYR